MVRHDIAGKRYGFLTAIKLSSDLHCRLYWVCRCDCGNVKAVSGSNLTSGHSKSCGCLGRHHLSKTPTYTSWAAMRNRFKNKRNPNYPRYGGRGIKVCDRWDSFEQFLADVGVRPSLEFSIGRIDNDGDYCPENCRWETSVQQNNNRRRPMRGSFLTFDGRTMKVCDWAKEIGISDRTLGYRIRSGWTVADALTTSISPSKSKAGMVSRRKSNAGANSF